MRNSDEETVNLEATDLGRYLGSDTNQLGIPGYISQPPGNELLLQK